MTDGDKQAPRGPHERWLDSDTRKTAIGAKCVDCMGGPGHPGVRAQIRDCTASGEDTRYSPCPLYAWRPYR
jgi:hypothetical protein